MNPPKFEIGEVPIVNKVHDDTMDDEGHVESKRRPMLILQLPSSTPHYQVVAFTTRKPNDNNSDYKLKDNGSPQAFGKMLGFDKASYLLLYPLERAHEKNMSQSNIKRFEQLFVDQVRKLVMARFMRPS